MFLGYFSVYFLILIQYQIFDLLIHLDTYAFELIYKIDVSVLEFIMGIGSYDYEAAMITICCLQDGESAE